MKNLPPALLHILRQERKIIFEITSQIDPQSKEDYESALNFFEVVRGYLKMQRINDR